MRNRLPACRCCKSRESVYYTQTDPIGLRGGINLYGYAWGDPVNQRDPFGLDCTLGAGIGGDECNRILAAIIGLMLSDLDVCSRAGRRALERFFAQGGEGFRWPEQTKLTGDGGMPIVMQTIDDGWTTVFPVFRNRNNNQLMNAIAHEEQHHAGIDIGDKIGETTLLGNFCGPRA